MTREALVVGAGIGGLAAAVALRTAGWTVTVFERRSELRPVGGGLTLAANAMAALDALGLAEPVRAAGAPLRLGAIRSSGGRVIVPPLGGPEGGIGILRGDLQRVLRAGAPATEVRTGRCATDVEPDEARPCVTLEGGGQREADLVVAADGLRSSLRASLHGRSEPRPAGADAWRGVADHDAGPVAEECWGAGERFGFVPVGGGRTYWFATVGHPAPPTLEDPVASKADLIDRFAGWHPPVESLLAATRADAIRRDVLHDRPPLPAPWGRGAVTLLGDAAHPMTPDLGQGAGQALEDAAALHRHLRGAEDLPAALRAFEAERAARVAPIVRASRRFGAVAQAKDPRLVGLRDALLGLVPAALQRRMLARLVRGGAA